LLAGYKGGYRGVLGHEFVGEVVDAPDAPEWRGERIVGEINVGCGHCSLCKRGLKKHCRQRLSLGIINKDGALAEYLTLPMANLHKVPPTVRDDQAVFVEPLAAALEILEQVHVQPSTRVYVYGSGKLGLLIAQVFHLTGCDLTVVGRHEANLAQFAAYCRCKTKLNTPENLAELAAEPADVVVEVTGAPQGFETALQLIRPGGTFVLKSTFAEKCVPVDLSRLVVNEVTVVGSRCGPFAPALRLLESRQVKVEPLIQAHYHLDDAVAALDYAGQRGVLKVLVHTDAI
jgi:threonine dehydrogenase-like Zn-dependent dehydrogenase